MGAAGALALLLLAGLAAAAEQLVALTSFISPFPYLVQLKLSQLVLEELVVLLRLPQTVEMAVLVVIQSLITLGLILALPLPLVLAGLQRQELQGLMQLLQHIHLMVSALLLLHTLREAVAVVILALDLYQFLLAQTFMFLQTVAVAVAVRPQMLPQLQTEGLGVKKPHRQVCLALLLP